MIGTVDDKLISVIIPVFNVEKYLQKCIDSVRNQTYRNLEIILIDDGSLDNSGKICDEYVIIDKRIKVVHKKNGGLSSARNAGLDVCQGDFIGFVDGDDYIEPEMYSELLNLEYEKNNYLSITGMIDEDEDCSYAILKHEKNELTNIEYLRELLLFRGDSSVCSKLFPKSILDGIRFQENRLNEDVLFILKIIPKILGIQFTNINGYHYVKHKESITHNFGKAIHDMVLNASEIRNFVENNFPMLKSEAECFELHQNIAFLCAVPLNYNRKNDPMCESTLKFVRSHIKRILQSCHLSFQLKLKGIMIALWPKSIPLLVRLKNKM